MKSLLLIFLCSFLLSCILMPLLLKLLKKLSASQTILSYVGEHKQKNGTTTMGGIVFIIVACAISFFAIKFELNWVMVLLVSVFFGILGFMDDYLKIKYHQNLGLRPYQKIIGQLGISIIFAFYIYFSNAGSAVFIPFANKTVDLGIFVIPLIILVLVACTNSVNLTDGLDGLAGNVTNFYLIFFIAISIILRNSLYMSGETGSILTNFDDITKLSTIFIGSICGFLLFNTSKASVFMGDVGSLCLGGFVGASACLLGLEFVVPILGFCFVFSAISVILQVAVFKLKHKRIFKMAPFHHHLQMSGLSEPKVVFIYTMITVVLGVLSIIFYLL